MQNDWKYKNLSNEYVSQSLYRITNNIKFSSIKIMINRKKV